MGYGEIGGGGSVKWTMVHKGSGGGSGLDPEPDEAKGEKGVFVVKVTTVSGSQIIGPFPIQKDQKQIQIAWSKRESGTAEEILQAELDAAKTELNDKADKLGNK